jgi:formate hydrogenlyase transcriptional activator
MALHPEERKRHFPEEAPVAWDPIRRALAEDEDWYRDLVQNSQDLLCVHDLEGRFLSVNPVPARLLGYTVEEMMRKPMRDFVDPQFRAQFDVYLREIARTGESRGLLAVVTRSGEQRIWEYHNTLRTEGVETPIVRGMAHDVTERVRAEKALRATNEQLLRTARERERMLQELTLFRTLLDQSNDSIEVVDPETLRLLDVNQRACVELGYSREELLSMTVFDIAPNVDESLRERMRQRLQESGFAIMEGVHRRKDGTTFPVEVNMRRVRLDREYSVAVSRDITARKRTEEALRETNEQLLTTAREQARMLQELTLFRTLLDQSNDAIKVIDSETLRFLDMNERSYAELGYSREELLSMTVLDIDPNTDESLLARVRQQLRESGFAIMETVHRRKDGTTFPVEVNMRRVRLDREYDVSISRDITARKRTEERLREFERVVENLEEMIVVVNREYRYVLANRAFLSYRGMTKEQLVGRLIAELLNPGVFETVAKEKLDECFQGKVVNYELRYRYPEMGERDLSITYLPVEGATGIDRVACVVRDVTEQKRAEEMLRATNEQLLKTAREQERTLHELTLFRTLLDQSNDAIKVIDPQTLRFLDVNERACLELGYSREELLSMTSLDIDGDVDERLRKQAEQQVRESGFAILERVHRRKDGTTFPVEVNMRLVRLDREYGVSIARDITVRKQAETALRESELRFRAVYERSPIGIALVDSRSGRFLQVNPKFCEITGREEEELLRTDVGSITHPDDIGPTRENLRQLAEEELAKYEMEKRYLRPDGSARWVRVLAVPMWGRGDSRRWHMGLVEDITERKRAEEALRQSEERFRVAIKNSPIAVFNQDRDLRYTWMYNSQLPFSDSEKLGKTVGDIFGPEEAARTTEVRRQVLETGVGVRDEMRATFGGRKHYFDTTIEPVLDAAGTVIGLTGASMDVTELREATEALREAKKKLAEEKLYLEQEIDTELGFGEIIGQSKALQEVMEQVGKVAASNATVLLLGETGTGKELVARAIHRLSRRADTSFIKLNCAAIPSGLLESELFGNEKGAFTGAVSKKIGRLELADKGTLFLDEIGEISLALQPKLLRVLQDQEFERLGGTQTLKVDFRLIAATNRNLADSVREREFRSDLYYRLNVFPIRVPPLRERREDIALLVEHFVQKCARRMNKSITSIPKKTMEALIGWEWPGNVRELENFIERSVILTQGSVLVSPLSELQPITTEKKVDETLEAAEREHILRALRESHGQIGGLKGAAARLGLKRTTLQSKLKHLGINPRSGSL